jgi:ribonuclease HII
MLSHYYNLENKYEIGVDEAKRGPLFGRLYVVDVIAPEEGFNNQAIKDSKKIKSHKKMIEIADFIKKMPELGLSITSNTMSMIKLIF